MGRDWYRLSLVPFEPSLDAVKNIRSATKSAASLTGMLIVFIFVVTVLDRVKVKVVHYLSSGEGKAPGYPHFQAILEMLEQHFIWIFHLTLLS